jgi:hypothetical protein
MDKYQVGQLFFLRDVKSLFGRAIHIYNEEMFEEVEHDWLPTHYGQIVKVEADRILIAEAGPNGYLVEGNWYSRTGLDDLIKEDKVRLGESKVPLSNVFESCKKYEGRPYDWYSIFKIGLFLLTGYEGFIWNGDSHLFCSEAGVRTLYEQSNGKIILGYNKNQPEEKKLSEYKIYYELISPAHIYLSKYVRILKNA